MPYTDEFQRILNKYLRLYTDKSRAFTFAFQEAFEKGVKTFKNKEPLFKRQNPTQFGEL